MTRLYIYPTYTPERDKSGNKYIKYFTESLLPHFSILRKWGKIGIFSMYFNLKAEIFIFHWVDLIVTKQKGILQVFFFLVGINILSFTKKKIVWVLHNKKPHRVESKIAEYCMKVVAEKANVIICHTTEGEEFVQNEYGSVCKKKVKYIPHPVYSNKIHPTDNCEWDLIIWGTISPYKNILEFLRFVNKSEKFQSYNILICGFCADQNYAKLIESEITPRITFINEFIEDEKLNVYMQKSKAILFTYKLDSVLCSGALVYSLNFNKLIIGPSGGAFKDLESIVQCYSTFDELNELDLNVKAHTEMIDSYIKNNTWDQFPGKLKEIFDIL